MSGWYAVADMFIFSLGVYFVVITAKSKDGFSRQSWKEMQQTMTDSGKFIDMLRNVPWEDGLDNDVTLG